MRDRIDELVENARTHARKHPPSNDSVLADGCEVAEVRGILTWVGRQPTWDSARRELRCTENGPAPLPLLHLVDEGALRIVDGDALDDRLRREEVLRKRLPSRVARDVSISEDATYADGDIGGSLQMCRDSPTNLLDDQSLQRLFGVLEAGTKEAERTCCKEGQREQRDEHRRKRPFRPNRPTHSHATKDASMGWAITQPSSVRSACSPPGSRDQRRAESIGEAISWSDPVGPVASTPQP